MTGVAIRYLAMEACDGPFGSSLTSSHYTDEGTRVIRLGNIGRGRWRGTTDAYISDEYASTLAHHRVEKGDVVVAGLGDGNHPLGRACEVPEDALPAIVKADCFRLRLDGTSVDRRFFVYAMNAVGTVEADKRSHGSTRSRLPLSSVLDIKLPLPSLGVQRRVADMLDVETARIDTLISKNQRALDLAWQRYRLLRQMRIAGGAPVGSAAAQTWTEAQGWHTAPLWLTCLNHDSKRVPLNAEERGQRLGPYPYWGANSIQDYVDDWLFDGEFVLIGEDGAPFFEPTRDVAWVARGRFWVNNHAHILEPVGLTPSWVAESLNVTDYSLFITGSTRDKLTQDDLNRIPVSVPPPETQLAIVDELARVRQTVVAMQGRSERQEELLRLRRQALITTAVTGQIDV